MIFTNIFIYVLVKISHPDSIPGLVDHHQLNVENNLGSPLSISSCQSTPTSDESNSTTELNSYKRLMDKPPLIKVTVHI